MFARLQFDFHGMDPSDWTSEYMEAEFESLLALAPRNCHMKLRINTFDSGIEGKLVAYSDRGAFVVEDKAGDVTMLTKALKKKMKAKLQKWRDTVHAYQHGKAG